MAQPAIILKDSEQDVPTPVTEGSTTILFPSANEVFYNPVQQFNRDLSVLAIRAWSNIYARERQEQHQQRQTKKRKLNSCDASHDHSTEPTTEEPQSDLNVSSPQPGTTFTVLEALSATGLRAIRYAQEIPNLSTVTANDLSAYAVKQIRTNSEHNGTTDRVIPNQGDARVVMYTAKKRFNVIDLDPYGSAAPFLDAAVQAVEDGGLLLITCTDLAVLAGDAHPEKCWSQYGGAVIRQSEFCHEQALRMVINTISTSAGRYGRAVTPLLSLSIDFYVRIFVRVHTSPAQVKLLMSNTMLTFQCSGCKTFINQPLGQRKPGSKPDLFKYSNASLSAAKTCEECGFSQIVGGPMYSGPLHDHAFIDEVLNLAVEQESLESTVYGTLPRVKGMLSVAKEELLEPHHWSLAKITKVLHCQNPPRDTICSAILNAGYSVSASHTGPRFIKTNAPASFMWDVMRAWIKLNPIREASIKPGSPGAAILSRREPASEIDFTYNKQVEVSSKGLVRFQINPTENWGPKTMAKGTTSDTATQFREKRQKQKHEAE